MNLKELREKKKKLLKAKHDKLEEEKLKREIKELEDENKTSTKVMGVLKSWKKYI